LESAGAANLAELETAIQNSDRLRALQREADEVVRRICDAGDGLATAELSAEVASDDATTRESRLGTAQGHLEELLREREAIAIAVHEAQRRFDNICGESNAAEAEAQRVEAVAAMGDAIDRYVRVHTAARLLKWAIERFRKERQGPLLARASTVFATLTLEEFGQLAVEYDDKDRPSLSGLRKNGKNVPLDGMSTGTIDQLYMALRIAAIETRLANAPPLPFVADDLFVHYDDQRAAAGFRVLMDLARRTQVIFFTHHDHLLDVARAAVGHHTFNVVRL
jgi:uncharacterized protein YhaN